MSTYLPADAVLQIDLEAVQKNYAYMQSLTGPAVTNAAVVKSGAYGLGLVPVAKALEQAGCRFFFVADLEEGVQLRSACPAATIAIFRGDLARYGAVYRRYRLMPVVNTAAELVLLTRATLPLPFILHVDTGLTRFGLCPGEVTRLYLGGAFERAALVGIVSHLACAAQPDAPVNDLQWHRFEAVYRMLGACCGSLVASAGVWLGKRYHFDMVRLGSALFGLNDARVKPNPLRTVLYLSAPVLEVRTVPRREVVGYAATFRTRRTSRIAVLGIGYRHGLPWSCANRISVRFGRFSAPVVGRISMEYVTVDVTDVPDSVCHPGSWAELLGDRFGPDDMADATGAVSQEIMLRLGACCPRRYVPLEPDTLNAPGRAPTPQYAGLQNRADRADRAMS